MRPPSTTTPLSYPLPLVPSFHHDPLSYPFPEHDPSTTTLFSYPLPRASSFHHDPFQLPYSPTTLQQLPRNTRVENHRGS